MPAVAVGFRFNQRRKVLISRPPHSGVNSGTHSEHIVTINDIPRHRVPHCANREVLDGTGFIEGRAHRERVVLNHVHNWQLPKRSERETFMKCADINRPISHEADRDSIVTAILCGKGESRCHRDLSADDAPAAKEVVLDIVEVHRAAAASRATGVFAKQLCHTGAG